MSFETDKQTLDDLNLLGKYKNNSIYSQYDKTVTRGGSRILEMMFLNPLTEAATINARSAVFRYFVEHDFEFPFTSEEFDGVEQYLGNNGGKGGFSNALQLLRAKARFYISNAEEYNLIRERVILTLSFLRKVRDYFEILSQTAHGTPFQRDAERGFTLSHDARLEKLMKHPHRENPGLKELLFFDRQLRAVCRIELDELLKLLHIVDVNVVVSNVARENHFCFAVAVERGNVLISVKGVHHPRLRGAVSNDVDIRVDKNVFFLTGANMAGKSTLMKSFGIAVYLAHMGFPVAATSMTFQVQAGMYTSINVPDNINLGYSHFYAEVLRVKKVAIEISKDKHLLVIFDELFKGTNVKDAYDATLAVTEAVAGRKNCAFMVSTHIIEVGQELGSRCSNVTFEYLPTVMEGAIPTYTYKLKQGITGDKHGMIIINNEKIIETIKGEV